MIKHKQYKLLISLDEKFRIQTRKLFFDEILKGGRLTKVQNYRWKQEQTEPRTLVTT